MKCNSGTGGTLTVDQLAQVHDNKAFFKNSEAEYSGTISLVVSGNYVVRIISDNYSTSELVHINQ